jgi:flagellar hook protein FlgE
MTAADGSGPVDTVDLSSSAIALLSAKNDFAANAAAFKAADEMTKSTINLLG